MSFPVGTSTAAGPAGSLFDLASTQARWLSARQTAIAGNIANANTAGYRAVDVEPFSKMLEGTSGVTLAATEPGHLGRSLEASIRRREVEAAKLTPSGSGVVLEDEFVKAGEVRRDFEMNAAIVRAFHRMLLSAVKG
jgi:flagellar basal-body rod protein FlgB